MIILGWYVLYRDGLVHKIRAADGLDDAIVVAAQLRREGRNVVQLGPLDKKRENEVIGGSEIDRLCAERPAVCRMTG